MHALPSIPWLGLTRAARIGLLFAGLCLGALSSERAHAQANTAPPPASERDVQARRLFEQGREAYADGRYRDAWAYFHEAYQLSGRPELLFNIGQTADRLGQESDAVTAFSMYLERLPAAPNRKDVENRVHALQDRVAASQQAQQTPPPSAAAPARPAAATERREAQPAASAAPAKEALPTPPAIVKPPKEPRRGFILRAGLGVGYRGQSMTSNTSLLDETPGNYTINGWGLALDLGVGWGVLPGFAVGGGVFLDWASSPTLTDDGGSESKLSFSRLTMIGPFVDWYPVRKTLGWYILGSLGLSVLSYKNTDNNPDGVEGEAYGLGIALGTGYEWNLSTSVGLGVELRFLTAVLAGTVGEETTSHVVTSPSLLGSLTWF